MAGEQIEFGFGTEMGRRRRRHSLGIEGSDNFLIGIQPDEIADTKARGIACDWQARLAIPASIRPLHVTMQKLRVQDVWPLTSLLDTIAALSSVRFQPFSLVFDEAMTFKIDDVEQAFVLCSSLQSEALFALRRKIFEARQQPGVEPARTPTFTPHMTLFYTRKRVKRQKLDAPVQWVVDRFGIIRSHVGETRHEILWPRTG